MLKKSISNRKVTAMLLAAAIIMQTLMAAPAVLSASPNFGISSDKQTLVTGVNNIVTFTIINNGSAMSEDTRVTLSVPSNVMLLVNSDGYYYIGNLSMNETAVFSATIYVASSAAGNLQQLTFNINYTQDGIEKTERRTLGFKIERSPPAYLYVNPSSQAMVAGTENRLSFTITNTGGINADNVEATLSLGNNMMLVGSDGRWDLGDMPIGGSAGLGATVFVSSSAAGSLVQLTFNFAYEEGGLSVTDSRTVSYSVNIEDQSSPSLVPSFSEGELEAGTINALSLIVVNSGLRDAKNVTITLGMPGASLGQGQGASSIFQSGGLSSLSMGGSQFMLLDSDGEFKFSGISRGANVTIPIRLYAVPGAVGTIASFMVSFTYSDGFEYVQESRPASMLVANVPSTTGNFNISVDKQSMVAGSVENLTLTITNTGETIARSVALTLSLSGSSTSISGGSSFTQGAVAPQGSSSSLVLLGDDGSWSLGDMAENESRNVTVSIFVNPSASGSIAALSLSTSYTDFYYESKQESKSIGMIIKGSLDIIVLEATTFPQKITLDKTFSVSVNLLNIGTSLAQSMLVTPSGNTYLVPVATDKVFLGDVEVNVPTSFTLSYVASGASNGTYTLHLPYTCKDSLGENIQGVLDVPITLAVVNSTNGGSGTTTGSSLLSYLPYMVVLAAAIVVVVAIVKLRKR